MKDSSIPRKLVVLTAGLCLAACTHHNTGSVVGAPLASPVDHASIDRTVAAVRVDRAAQQRVAERTNHQPGLVLHTPWLILHTAEPVLRTALEELLANPRFRAHADSAFAPLDREAFSVYVGGSDFLRELNSTRQQKVRIPQWAGGITLYTDGPGGSVRSGAIVIDIDKLHLAVEHDSARARTLVRDALIHEFGHLIAVAGQRHIRARTGDPERHGTEQWRHPIMRAENALRQLIGLPARTTYGLVDRS